MRALALVLLLVACNDQPRIASCRDNLHGVWVAPSGRWMILDYGAKLEAFALFDDAADGGAPRVIDLARRDTLLDGEVKRRYQRAADSCNARAPIRVTRCAADELELVLADPEPPLAYSPCAWPRLHAPSRVERWRRD